MPYFAVITVSILLLTSPSVGTAATCSCAGVPLLSSMDTSSTEPGKFYFNFTTEVHEISDLVSGSSDVNDETNRERSTFSQVFSGSYGLSDNWSLSALVSRIVHKRKVGISFFGEQKASGFGDSVLLARYTPIHSTPFSRNELSLGFGVRIPTGENDAGDVIPLSEDMQPSTGAFGGILWASYSRAFNQAATLQFVSSANYTFNKDNDRKYAFGDQLNIAAGIIRNSGSKFGFSGMLRYRWTDADERDGFKIPNTGGQWLDFVPAIQYSVTDKFGVGLSGRIPVVRNLKGVLQFTTSYSYALALSYAY